LQPDSDIDVVASHHLQEVIRNNAAHRVGDDHCRLIMILLDRLLDEILEALVPADLQA